MAAKSSTLCMILLHMCFIHLSICNLNQYEMVNASFWRSITDFKPIPSTQYGTIQLLHSLRMEFALIFHERHDYTNWQNIFRIGYKSANNSCYGYGSRYPSLWLTPQYNHLNLGISQQGDCHYNPWRNYPIEKNQTYYISIQFNDSWVQMNVNQESVISERRQHKTLRNIYNQHLGVWISTDKTITITDDINIILSNITIKTWNATNTTTTTTTSSTTPQPTDIPTNTPTNTPSNQPTQTLTGAQVTATTDSSSHPTASFVEYTRSSTLKASQSTFASFLSTLTVTVDDATTNTLFYSSSSSDDIEDNTMISLPPASLYRNIGKYTEQNLLFLIVGILLALFVCLGVIGIMFLCFCCNQRKRRTSVKYHVPPKQSSSKQERKTLYCESENSVILRRNTSLCVTYDTEQENRESFIVAESEIEGYSMFDDDIVADLNPNTLSVENNFEGMLMNANAVNNMMLNDIIAEMATEQNKEMGEDEEMVTML